MAVVSRDRVMNQAETSIAIYAMRYALPLKTGAPCQVAEYLKKRAESIAQSDKVLIKKEIIEFCSKGDVPAEQVATWYAVLEMFDKGNENAIAPMPDTTTIIPAEIHGGTGEMIELLNELVKELQLLRAEVKALSKK